MSTFLLPVEITRNFERSLSKYWWGAKDNSNSGISWMSWERLSKHKMKGGMRFGNFRDFNLALLGKQGWRFISRPNRLASRLFKALYFQIASF